MKTYIIKQIPRVGGTNPVALHEIVLPSLNEKKGYVTAISLDAFRFGQLRGKPTHFSGACCFSKDSCFVIVPKDEFLRESKVNADIMYSVREGFPAEKYYKMIYGQSVSSPESLTMAFKHASLDDFYKHIGFDKKKRRYTTK